ncbi:cadherin repeat domain-containing protein, partial [Xanthobacter variabilis]|uniref:cadherin repeat domain-containing protein n=1 Tax=Xanthobacter variabilis TaxID=3119932 RepID=UPI00374F6AFE
SLSGTDAALFKIDAKTGALTFKSAPNYESPADKNKDNVYDVTVLATDSAKLTDTQAIKVTVTNTNEAP